MKTVDWILTIGALLLAAGLYALMGRPGLPDQPMSKRTAELERKAPEDMTSAEWLARLEVLTQERPEDPQPHYFIGQLLANQGRDEDAVRAYQSALRRDNTHVPALLGLGDALLRMSNGEVSPELSALFQRAYQLDRTQLRAGFLVGVADWQAGDEAAAQAYWAEIENGLPEGGRDRAGFSALVSTFVRESRANSAAVPPN
ncbi:MAG: tetratricopeptide repeat protein [Pseudomonadota bacterium]